MATNKKVTINEVQDIPKIKVDQDSRAALLVSKKFVDVVPSTFVRGFSEGQGIDDDELNDGTEESIDFQAPEYSDIFIKYNGVFESPDPSPSRRYGTLYTSAGYTDLIELEFKVMIPEDVADQIVGVQILSGNEVVASS